MDRKEALIKSAEYYIKSWFSLIPVWRNKIPLIQWKEYQERKATIEEVSWWIENLQDVQLGAVTWKISNIIVVDIEEWGNVDWLPRTAIAKTWGGWFHYYYSYVPWMTNKVRIKNLTDIRSDGWYVILPPSSSDKWQYSWLVKERPVVFPRHLFEEPTINQENYTQVSTDYPWYGAGQRNNEMAKYIGHILAKVHPSEWDNIAYRLVEEANAKNNPPLDDRELRTTFESIKNLERRNNSDRWYKKDTHEKDSEMWKEVDNKILLMKDIAAMEQYAWGDRYKMRIPFFDNALGGWFEDWDLCIVSGMSWFGKTTFAQSLAVNFAEQGLPVLFLSYEVKVSHLWNKFKEMGIEEDLVIYSVQKNTSGNVGWVEEKIREAKESYEIKMVVIDHLWFLMPKAMLKDISSNYALYVTQICRDLKQIALRENIIIVMPVHVRKTDDVPDMNSLANSAGISQESDEVFILHREKNKMGWADYYMPQTKIMMVKNRKTGQAVQGYFNLHNWRFIHDEWAAVAQAEPEERPLKWTGGGRP